MLALAQNVRHFVGQQSRRNQQHTVALSHGEQRVRTVRIWLYYNPFERDTGINDHLAAHSDSKWRVRSSRISRIRSTESSSTTSG